MRFPLCRHKETELPENNENKAEIIYIYIYIYIKEKIPVCSFQAWNNAEHSPTCPINSSCSPAGTLRATFHLTPLIYGML